MITITVDEKQKARIKQYLNDKRFVNAISKVLVKAGYDLEDKIVENIYERASNTGTLAQSWHVEELDKLRVKVFTGLEYATFVEFGTRPHRPPIEPIRNWVRLKFNIHSPKKLESTSWKVWWKIAKKGTPEKRYFRDAVEDFDLNEYIDTLIKEWENV